MEKVDIGTSNSMQLHMRRGQREMGNYREENTNKRIELVNVTVMNNKLI